jgi:hypothetical protein
VTDRLSAASAGRKAALWIGSTGAQWQGRVESGDRALPAIYCASGRLLLRAATVKEGLFKTGAGATVLRQ